MPSESHTVRELLAPDTGLAFEAMRALRPALASREELVQRVDAQRRDGYRLVAALPREGEPASAVAGFRVGTNLAWGRHLYVDDLSTLPAHRGQGLARRLLAWLREEAERAGAGELHLDSGVGAERADAHRLYFAAGFRISSYHFRRAVGR